MAGASLPGLAQVQSPGPSLQAPTASTDPVKMRKAAQDFEAMVIGQFLQPMFDTVDTSHSKFGGGSAEAAWKPMMVQEMGKQIAAHGGLGLTEPIHAAMLQMQEAKTRHAK